MDINRRVNISGGNKVKKNKGTIIIFVVIIIGIVGLLYSSVYVLIGIERKINQSLINRTKAYYIAESGLERGLAIAKQKGKDEFETSFPFTLTNPFSPQYKEGHTCTVSLVFLPEADKYIIRSEGKYGTVEKIVEAEILKGSDTFLIQSRKEAN